MKNLEGLAVIFLAALCSASAQQGSAAPPSSAPIVPSVERPSQTFFPRHWIRGYTDFEYAPPTNEPDLGRCSSSTGQFGGPQARCAAFARYVLSAYVEMQPIGRTALRHVFLFAQPRSFFGNNVPQIHYTEAATPIAWELLIGAGIELPKNFEIRVTRHAVYWMGRYGDSLGPADLSFNGPYGRYATAGVRWSFGGWGHGPSE